MVTVPNIVITQKRSRLQMFFKLGVLKNFAKFHRKTPVLESLFNKVPNLKGLQLKLKRTSITGVFL